MMPTCEYSSHDGSADIVTKAQARRGDALNVLLVDDSEDDYVLTSDLLMDADGLTCHLTWVDSYAAALEALIETPPDVCLLDYRLDARTGIDLLRAANELDISVPTIMLTGTGDRALDIEAMEHGAVDYLVKYDLRSDVLERTIRYALERKRLMDALTHVAKTDALTGLANRAMFNEQMPAFLSNAERHQRTLALLYVDLNGFKRINDNYGHSTGDAVLVEVARRIEELVRAEDMLARLGSDEFIIILQEVDEPRGAARVAEKILEVMSTPVAVGATAIECGASIGIVTSGGHASADELIRKADVAMYEAKRDARSGYRFYDSEIHAATLARAELEQALSYAAPREELRLHYQVQVDAKSGRACSMEALMRWEHPQMGFLQPGDFIEIAESCGAINAMGEWVLHRACRDFKALSGEFPSIESVAVNVSMRQLSNPDFVAQVFEAVRRSGLTASQLEIEVTETSVMEDTDLARRTLTELASVGIRVALDDFGTGYSSLTNLRQLPIRTLKIDRSFVDGIGTDHEDQTIVEVIVSLASQLSLGVIAEGVETRAQADFLETLGCSLMQGYFYSKPIPLAELRGRLSSGSI